MAEVLAHPVSRPPLRIILDRRTGDARSPEFIGRMAQCAKQHAGRLVGARIAMVVADHIDAAMADMTVSVAEESDLPVTVRTFEEYGAAERWLAADNSPAATAGSDRS